MRPDEATLEAKTNSEVEPAICNRIICIVPQIHCEPNCSWGWFFLFLGVALIVVALHPRWRSRCGWGRSGQGGPLSAFGWLAWIFTFLAFSASAFRLIGVNWGIAGVLLVMAAGIFDSVRNSKRR